MVMNTEDKIEVGNRIESEGYFGTVKYVGPVALTKGNWIGVDWDDPKRGKHNGTHEGHVYFSTRHEASGSFIREKKANTGVNFMQAIEDRYGFVEDETGGVIEEDMFVVGKNHQQTVVEVVGAKKINKTQSQVDQIKEVAFRGMAMSGLLEREFNLGAVLKRVTELDISRTLVSSWKCVGNITKTLRTLQLLNVSSNQLEFPAENEELKSCFKCIKELRINRMGYTWNEVLKCTAMFPSLRELHCCFNNIKNISGIDESIMNLKLLNLESNPIESWTDVLHLGNIPELEIIIINQALLKEIQFPDVAHGQKTGYFRRLSSIYLNHNKLEDWKSISELNKLHNLTDLHVKKNPVTTPSDKMTEETSRYLTIAKISSLKTLNRSDITKEERQSAEYDYLRMFGKEWRTAGGNQDPALNNPSQKFCDNHPRYQEHINKYGALDDALFKVFSSALKNSLITVKLSSPNTPDKAVITKKLPVTMTVGKVKALLQRLFKADPLTMKVGYTSQKMEGQVIEMDADQREIGYFSIEEGDNVILSW